MSTLRIVLADDHRVLREGLKALIATQPDMRVVGEASNGRALLLMVQDLRPDVVLVDVSMPDVDGASATAQITQMAPSVRVLALSLHAEMTYVRLMLKAGAAGYVRKQSAPVTLIGAIRAVAAGETFLDEALGNDVVCDLTASST